MITSKKVRKLVKTFERMLPHAVSEASLDMCETKVSHHHNLTSDRNVLHKCGTVHCHAGWYLLAKMWDGKSDYMSEDRMHYYNEGIVLMVEDLGFYEDRGLKCWARDNPDLWGNDEGTGMFVHSTAFASVGKRRARTLKDIVDHWRQVGDALEIAEIGDDYLKRRKK